MSCPTRVTAVSPPPLHVNAVDVTEHQPLHLGESGRIVVAFVLLCTRLTVCDDHLRHCPLSVVHQTYSGNSRRWDMCGGQGEEDRSSCLHSTSDNNKYCVLASSVHIADCVSVFDSNCKVHRGSSGCTCGGFICCLVCPNAARSNRRGCSFSPSSPSQHGCAQCNPRCCRHSHTNTVSLCLPLPALLIQHIRSASCRVPDSWLAAL